MNKNDTQSHSVTHHGLRLILRLSGLRQDYVARKFDVSPEYLSMILNGKRQAKRLSQRILNYLLAHNSLEKNIAA